MFIEGIFLQGDLQNRNGRMYPMECTPRKEVQRYNENHVQSGRALGELGHPDGPTVNLDQRSLTKLLVSKRTEPTLLVKQRSYLLRWVILPKSLIGEGVKLGCFF